MPNGKTHSILTVMTSAALFSISNYLQFDIKESLSLMTGGLIGLVLHPDLDQVEIRKGLWNRIWWIYGKSMAHRSFLSHFPIISTMGRLIYILGIPLFLLWWYYPIENSPYLYLGLYGIIGLMIVDTIHYLADIISSKIKRI